MNRKVRSKIKHGALNSTGLLMLLMVDRVILMCCKFIAGDKINGSLCSLCLQHAYEEPSPRMTNLMRGANFDQAKTNPFVVDAYLMFQVS